MITAREALQRLQAGNRRFVAGRSGLVPSERPARRECLADGQEPFAIILGCSDSRSPVELIFDQDIGDLFVVRVAGNVVGPSQMGSVEFAATRFGARLVVVLGHSQCGAIAATLQHLEQPGKLPSPSLEYLVERIRPAVEPLLGPDETDRAALLASAVRANVRASVDRLRNGSALLARLVQGERLMVIGAEYCLSTGVVDFFDETP